MSEYQMYVAIKNGFIYLGQNRWTRLGDPTLYDDDEVLLWLSARHLLEAA